MLSLRFQQFGSSEFPLLDIYRWEQECPENLADDNGVEADLLTCDNIPAYIKRSLEFAMDKGIAKQMRAFKCEISFTPDALSTTLSVFTVAGFERVIPLRSLALFYPQELGKLISGETVFPEWTANDLLTHCEPVCGYTKMTTGFLMLIETLTNLDGNDRRAFLRFVTGCPTLPPGGLKNLHPRIKVSCSLCMRVSDQSGR